MRKALVVILLLLPGVAIAGVLAVRAGGLGWPSDLSALPLEERYERADSWDAFLARHGEDAARWEERYARAGGVVAGARPELERLDGHWRLLVVTEAWCGDSRYTIPVLARAAAETDALDLRILSRRDGGDLLADHPASEGRTAIPLVLVLDHHDRIRGAWVEQPAPLQSLIAERAGEVRGDVLHDEVVAWYEADGGRTALTEILALIRHSR